MKDVFIGQIVVAEKQCWRDERLPLVGKVVDIAYEYDYNAIMTHHRSLERAVRVLPVVKFLGEQTERPISPEHISQYE